MNFSVVTQIQAQQIGERIDYEPCEHIGSSLPNQY